MAGHNKWSKVKHKKAITDAKKSKAFSEAAREITHAVKEAGGSVDSPSVKQAIEKARGVNMPKDNIDRAIARGTGESAGTLAPVLYEAYGPGGTALLIEGATDNPNRTAGEVKRVLGKRGLALSEQGSAQWAFTKHDGAWKPHVTTPVSGSDAETLAELARELEELDDVEAVTSNAEV